MIVDTYYFGEIEFSEEDVIVFDEGIYGFGGMRKFIIIYNPEENLPFHWLQSIEDSRLSFIITSPFLFVENYEFDIPVKITEKMELKNESDVVIYCIAVIPEDVQNSTINLKAPIVFNKRTRKAKQYILDEEYPYKHNLFTNKPPIKDGDE